MSLLPRLLSRRRRIVPHFTLRYNSWITWLCQMPSNHCCNFCLPLPRYQEAVPDLDTARGYKSSHRNRQAVANARNYSKYASSFPAVSALLFSANSSLCIHVRPHTSSSLARGTSGICFLFPLILRSRSIVKSNQS